MMSMFTMTNLRVAVAYVDQAIVTYYLALNAFYLMLLLLSILEVIRRRWEIRLEHDELAKDGNFIPISILCPAYNESLTIVSSIRAMLNLDYPEYELIVVNDGSADNTMDVLKETFQLYEVPATVRQTLKTQTVRKYYRSMKEPKLMVIDKENGGKSDALNAGVNACETPLFLACDADTLIEKSALRSLASSFLISSKMVACGGTIRVANNCTVEKGIVTTARFPRDVLPAMQAIEYLRAFFLGRLGWNRLGGNLVVSGALGLFDRDLVLAAGGYATGIVGEDMELIMRLHRHYLKAGQPRKVRFIADPLAWTEVPDSVSQLGRQRERWHRGLIDSLWKHRGMLFNPRYRRIGFISYPFFLWGEMMAPAIEAIGIIGVVIGFMLQSIDENFVIMFFLAAWGVNILMNLVAILVEQLTYKRYDGWDDLGRMVFYAFVENVGLRQLTVWWRLKGFWSWLRGNRTWGTLARKGFS
jgi:cellulose synthase/poly-beta-1,6-N-acetylglucosamine synthase-like glycosyltransferase